MEIWIYIAALITGQGLAWFANWKLELGQPVKEIVACGNFWAAAFAFAYAAGRAGSAWMFGGL